MHDIRRPALLDGSFHHHLLRDEARLSAYAEAIGRVVREGDVVADVGSGSGVLAWLAARAGARRVFAVEANSQSYQALLRLARENGAQGRVVPTLADGTTWTPPEPVDVVVCELMETGLLHEPIAAVMRNVRAWARPPRAVVPRAVDLLVEGVAMRDDFLGYRARLPGFRAIGEEEPALTDLATYASFDFGAQAPPVGVDAPFSLRAAQDGVVSGLQLRTRSRLAEGVALGASPAYCTPVALPLEAPVEVRAGDRLEGRIAYGFDYSAQPLRFDLRRT